MTRSILVSAATAVVIVGSAAGGAFPANATPHDFIMGCPSGEYENSSGNCVPVPTQAPSAPTGATAQCRDGSWSFSEHRSGTCSGHGGVAVWL